ncbi:MAG: choice-of-anchor L domain-containing protein [Flavobacteriales bacterium]|nr:choice-of-anchor L domain-containing protein [Flavobacteriales bacterium]
MKKIIGSLVVIFALVWNNQAAAQIVIDDTQTPQQLVEEVLLGQGVVVSNITFTGAPEQIGYFNALNGNFPIEEGVVLSSGNVSNIPGTGATFSSAITGSGGDPDLDIVSNAGTNDAVVLEFDFVPIGDSIKFDYIFGSEEYPEFVNSAFNDVFAFIISGPGFSGPFSNGGENIALIPGTTTPITIDNVNEAVNAQYYIDNNNGVDPDGIVYDGYTLTLTALAEVVCGETYHLKFALADAGDSSYDSGVFLKARSFGSNAFRFDIVTPSADSTVVEGCTVAEVNIFSPPADSTLVYDIIVSGNAIEGVDFTEIPDSLIIAPGDSVFSFTIEPLDDGISENEVDTIILTIYTINTCGDSVANVGYIFIVETYEIEIAIDEIPGPCIAYEYSILTPAISGGNPDFLYDWSTGDNTPSIEVGFAVTTDVSLTVTDQCGIVSNTVTVTVEPGVVPPQPEISVSNDVVLVCPSDNATLTAIATNGSAPYDYSWNSGDLGSTINVQPLDTTDYIVTVVDNCLLVVQDTITVVVLPYSEPAISINDSTIICPEDEIILMPILEDGSAPYGYAWSDNSTDATNTLNPTETVSISVTVTDQCGNSATDNATIEVPVYDPVVISLFNMGDVAPDTITICELWSDTLSYKTIGGLEPYDYFYVGSLIDGITSDNDSVVLSVPYELPSDSMVIEMYEIIVVDQCLEDDTVEIVVRVISCDIVQPGIFNPNSTFASTTDFCGQTPQNNMFNLPCLNLYPGNVVKIWDRWGRKCYEQENYHLKPWDGGNKATGVYYYVAEIPGEKEPVKGYFQLLR